MKRSWTSPPVVVNPHAIERLCPSTVKGTPGTVAPVTDSVGVSIRARYQRIGAARPRWGSLTRSGLPVVVREPESTHSFDAVDGPRGGGRAARSRSMTRERKGVVEGKGGAGGVELGGGRTIKK